MDASALIVLQPIRAVFIGSHSGYFERLNLETGQVVWSRRLTNRTTHAPSRIEASAALVRPGLVAVGTLDGFLYGFNDDSGEVMFQVDIGGAIKSPPTPIPDSSFLLTASHGCKLVAIDIDRPQTPVFEVVLDGSPVVAPIVLLDAQCALVASLSGNLHCIESATGEYALPCMHNNIASFIS